MDFSTRPLIKTRFAPVSGFRNKGSMRMPFKTAAIAVALTAVLALLAVEAPAQQGVCNDTPEPGGWIDCREPADSSTDIDIDARNLTITTTDDDTQAIGGLHEGAGDIGIIARDLIINTNGSVADGISASHAGEGEIEVDLKDVIITTKGSNADGVYGFHEGAQGGVHIDVQNTDITTSGDEAEAILAIRDGAGEIEILARKALFETEGEGAEGVHGLHRGAGDVHIGVQNIKAITTGAGASGVRGSHVGTGAIELDLKDVTIMTQGGNADGVYAIHVGEEGAVLIQMQGGEITTMGQEAEAIRGTHEGADSIGIDVQGIDITTRGNQAEAIIAIHSGAADIEMNMHGVSIATEGQEAGGVHGLHQRNSEGDVNIDARNTQVKTTGAGAYGIRGSHGGTGAIDIDLKDVAITTEGRNADGVYGYHVGSEGNVQIEIQGGGVTTRGAGAEGILASHSGMGEIEILVHKALFETEGEGAEGILASHSGMGEIEILVRDALIQTEGEGSEGVHGLHRNAGGVHINAQGIRVTTTGMEAAGIQGSHTGTGSIEIDARGAEVATMNERSHGIAAYHGGSGSVRIAVDGGRVHAAGMDASGVRVGNADSRGRVTLAAEVDEEGYRKQSVTVNAPVTGGPGRDAAGVFLAGGGRVVIGPRGSLGAESRIAIRAAGDAPRLHVDMNLDGRRVTQVIGEDFIHNHEGETTLLINGVVLHDGEAGATGLESPNGAWDVTLLETPTVTGRIFSHNDFTEDYAPRAAVYEALPGFLLRLNGRGVAGKRIASTGTPVWVSLSNGEGSYEAERASVGAKYDFNHFGAEAGVSFSFGENLGGSISARYVNGSAEVESPAGNGDIKAQGIGAALGASWSNTSGYYAAGRTALIDYDVDASSTKRGELTKNGGALGYSVGIEAGMRVALGEKIKLTPRAWMMGAGFLNAEFTDAVNSRVSLDDSRRFKGGLGLIAETARTWEGGALSLHVLLDVEQALGDGGTTTVVSGEKLTSESAKTRVLLGLGGAYRQGPFSLGAELSAGGLGSDDDEYSGRVDFGMKF